MLEFKMMGFKFRSCGCVFAFTVHCLLIISVAKVTDPSEVSALMAVKGSLVDPMNHLSNWNKGDPCTSNWTGVICVHKNNADKFWHVQEIQLLNMNLSGRLAPELGQFSHLRILDFMWNNLTGSIPKEIGNISSLYLLLLNGNKLSGSLPVELGYLKNLNRFQIDENHISGSIPKSFSNLNNIKHIHFNNNSLTGQIPVELSNLSTLIHLLLDNNNLSGYLPSEFGGFPNIRILQLDNNHFEGVIPSSYGNISALVKLSLRNCSLQGVVPDLSGMRNLSYIYWEAALVMLGMSRRWKSLHKIPVMIVDGQETSNLLHLLELPDTSEDHNLFRKRDLAVNEVHPLDQYVDNFVFPVPLERAPDPDQGQPFFNAKPLCSVDPLGVFTVWSSDEDSVSSPKPYVLRSNFQYISSSDSGEGLSAGNKSAGEEEDEEEEEEQLDTSRRLQARQEKTQGGPSRPVTTTDPPPIVNQNPTVPPSAPNTAVFQSVIPPTPQDKGKGIATDVPSSPVLTGKKRSSSQLSPPQDVPPAKRSLAERIVTQDVFDLESIISLALNTGASVTKNVSASLHATDNPPQSPVKDAGFIDQLDFVGRDGEMVLDGTHQENVASIFTKEPEVVADNIPSSSAGKIAEQVDNALIAGTGNVEERADGATVSDKPRSPTPPTSPLSPASLMKARLSPFKTVAETSLKKNFDVHSSKASASRTSPSPTLPLSPPPQQMAVAQSGGGGSGVKYTKVEHPRDVYVPKWCLPRSSVLGSAAECRDFLYHSAPQGAFNSVNELDLDDLIDETCIEQARQGVRVDWILRELVRYRSELAQTNDDQKELKELRQEVKVLRWNLSASEEKVGKLEVEKKSVIDENTRYLQERNRAQADATSKINKELALVKQKLLLSEEKASKAMDEAEAFRKEKQVLSDTLAKRESDVRKLTDQLSEKDTAYADLLLTNEKVTKDCQSFIDASSRLHSWILSDAIPRVAQLALNEPSRADALVALLAASRRDGYRTGLNDAAKLADSGVKIDLHPLFKEDTAADLSALSNAWENFVNPVLEFVMGLSGDEGYELLRKFLENAENVDNPEDNQG